MAPQPPIVEANPTPEEDKQEETKKKYTLGKDKSVFYPDSTQSGIELRSRDEKGKVQTEIFREGDEVELTKEQVDFYKASGYTLKASDDKE